MHDSFTPMGGFVPLLNMQLGEVVFGGVGAGPSEHAHLRRIIAVFIAGHGWPHTRVSVKKIEPGDVKMASLSSS
jgi:K+-transporting ATPase ATPase A chain